jgi:hypothetical protein
VSVPFIHRLRQAKRVLGFYRGGVRGDFYQYIFDKEEFRALLEQAGFKVEEQIPYDAVKGLSDESRVLRWWLDRTASGRRLTHHLAVSGCLDRWFGHMILFVGRKREA